jgi:hypothetical protein
MESKNLKIPESIKILGNEIKVKYDPSLFADRERYGEYCSRSMTITLDGTLSPQKTYLIFCHELVEAMSDIFLINIEEHQTQAFAVALNDIFNNGGINGTIEN